MIKCIICNNIIPKIKSLGQQPLANKYPKDSNEVKIEFKSQMDVHYCENCKYVNLPCKISRDIFFEDYYYLSSVNKELGDHFDHLASYIFKIGAKFILDVGSNDGILLSRLQNRNIKCLGIDPSENVSEIANRKGFKTIVGFFDEKSVSEIKKDFGKPDLITASSVFTHLEKPNDFFSNCKNLLSKDGKIIIEVEYLANIVRDFSFERFYFDRPHYYSLNSLIKLARPYGFELEDAEIIKVHGGSIRAIFSEGQKKQISKKAIEILNKENKLLSKNQLNFKLDEFLLSCKILKDKIIELKNSKIKFAAYGCPARFSTITNIANISKKELSYVVDDSPLKQGRFSPGVHIPIRSFNKDEDIDLFIVFAYEYIESIKNKIKHKNSIEFFKPIPFEKI